MLHRRDRATLVVRDDRVRGDQGRCTVDEHDTHSRALLGDQIALIASGRHDQQALDASVDERACKLALARRVLIEAAGQYQHAPFARCVLDGSVQRGRERVGSVLEQ